MRRQFLTSIRVKYEMSRTLFMNVLKWMIEILQKNVLFLQNVHKLMQRYIFYQLANNTPHFLQRGILEIYSAVFEKNRKIFNLHIGIKHFMKTNLKAYTVESPNSNRWIVNNLLLVKIFGDTDYCFITQTTCWIVNTSH